MVLPVGIEPQVPIFNEQSDYKNGASRPKGEAMTTVIFLLEPTPPAAHMSLLHTAISWFFR
jgi:hypothetical protein